MSTKYSYFRRNNELRIIKVEFGEPIPENIVEYDYDPVIEGTGSNWIDDKLYPSCFACSRTTDPMVQLYEIDDGCMNDYLCMDCVSKINSLNGSIKNE